MSARWYKRCGADFIHGTMSLSLEEKGAYSLCLDLIYDRGGPIPDDARWLSGVCGVSIRKWNALRDRLLSTGKIYVSNGLLSNARADLELVSTELQRRNQVESGAKGGRKRAENAASANENSDLAQATLKPIEEIRLEKKEIPNGILANLEIGDDAPLPDDDEKLKPEHVMESWNEVAAKIGKPVVRNLTPERRQLVRARIAQYSIDDFVTVFGNVQGSAFLRDAKACGFDWSMKKANFQKILEGNYS